MERLKKILRAAIAERADRVRLQAGAPVEIVSGGVARPLTSEAPIDGPYVDKLFGFLFPNEKAAIAARQPAKGALNVPNVGKILLLAQPAPTPNLRLYLPPVGHQMFEDDWTQVTMPAAAAAPPPPPGMMAPSDMFQLPGESAAHAVGGGASSPFAMPPESSAAAAAPPPGGFVPMFGGLDAEPAAASGLPPIGAPSSPTSSHAPASPTAPTPLGAVGSAGAIGLGMIDPGDLSAPAFGFVPADAAPAPIAVAASAPQPQIAPARQPSIAPQAPAQAAPNPQHQQQLQQMQQMQQQIQQQMQQLQQLQQMQQLQSRSAAQAAPASAAAPAAAPAPDDGEAPEISFAAEAEGASSDGRNPIDPILTDMIKRKASDLHVTCGEPICMRVDGEITRVGDRPVDAAMMARLLMPIFPGRNQREFAKIHDTDFAYEIKGVGRFRVNVFRDKNGVGTVMRHIPSKILTAEQLGLAPAILKFCSLTKGLVVVTGPTGSGKSTTLAAMLDHINKTRHDHILTIEDPIEFVHPQQRCLVNQREVHKHTTGFARALKAALREDPDIVLIGEMRDLETIAIAIETAETGHLVFGTLHTTTAVSTIDRIVDQFPTDRQEQIRMMLSSSLRGVVAQTLLKKKGGGRVAAHEILVTNDAVSAMVREGKNHMIPNHMQSQKADGNVLLNESLIRLVKEGIVEPEDAYMKAVDKNGLVELYKRLGIRIPAIAAPAGNKPAA
jgi:twitching motility protein PilT